MLYFDGLLLFALVVFVCLILVCGFACFLICLVVVTCLLGLLVYVWTLCLCFLCLVGFVVCDFGCSVSLCFLVCSVWSVGFRFTGVFVVLMLFAGWCWVCCVVVFFYTVCFLLPL